MRNIEVRGMENGLREIGFDSKPILEVDCREETHLKVGVGGENTCDEGETRKL